MITVNNRLEAILKANESRPIMRVEAYDTAFTYPSHGFFVRYLSGCPEGYFSDPVSAGASIKRTQFEDKIFHSFTNGIPTELSNYIGFNFTTDGIGTSDPYMISWSGSFFARQAGDYTFSTKAYGGTRFYIGNTFTDVLSGTTQTASLSTTDNWNLDPGKGTYFSGIATLATGWHPIKVEYGFFGGLLSGVNQGYISAAFTPPNGEETILSCSSVTPSGAFLEPIQLWDIMQLNETTDENGCEYTFEVPIIQNEGYIWNLSRESFGPLKPNNLIKVFAGYATESGYTETNGYTSNLQTCPDYVQRFIGFIDSVSISQNAESLTATVKCRDFSKKLLTSLNENFPDYASYTREILERVDRSGKFDIENVMPNCYDKWYLVDVIKDLCIHAGIDPIYIKDNLISIGNYFRLEHNLSWPDSDYIDEDGVEHKNGDPFLFRFGYGEKLYDLVNQVSELIGYKFKFDEQGNLFIKDPRYTKRIECFETSGVNSQAVTYSGIQYTPYFNINCSNRLYFCNVSGRINDLDYLIDVNTIAGYHFDNNSVDFGPKGYNLNYIVEPPYITTPTPPYGTHAVGPFSETEYYTLPSTLISDLQTRDKFSIEFNVYPIAFTAPQTIFALKEVYNTELEIRADVDANINFFYNGQGHLTPQNTLQLNQWNHVAIERGADKTNIFINNTGYYQDTNPYRIGQYGPITSGRIGSNTSGFRVADSLYLDQFRISYLPTLSNYNTPSYPTVDTSSVIEGSNVNVNFSGVGCSLFYSTSLAGGYNFIDIYNANTNALVFQTGFRDSGGSIKYNNKLFITNTLSSDNYKVTISPSGTTLFKFEGLEYYEKNIFKPEYYFRANEDISTISLDLTDENLRNEVIVVGQQQTDKQYLYGRAIDLDSISNPEAFNFAGGKRPFILIEPRLQNQQRIDWLSRSILSRYKKNERIMTVGCVGNPKLQEGDVIGVKSTKIGLDTETNIFANTTGIYNEDVLDVFYVKRITSQTSKAKYITNLTLTSQPPIESWKSYLPITKSLLSGYINTKGHIFDNFRLLTKNSTDYTSYDALSQAPCFISFESLVDLDRLWVFVDDRCKESVTYNNRYRNVEPQYPCYITETYVNIGDFVTAGQNLARARVSWAPFSSTNSNYFFYITAPVAGGITGKSTPATIVGPGYVNFIIDQGTTSDDIYEQLQNFAIRKFEGNTTLLGNIQSAKWDSATEKYLDVELPGKFVWMHNGGGELWGNLTLPTAMEESMGGGNYLGENSDMFAKVDGTYPIGIWGIGTYDDGEEFGVDLGLWHPPVTTIDSVVLGGINYPALKIKNSPTVYSIQVLPSTKNGSSWVDLNTNPTLYKSFQMRIVCSRDLIISLKKCEQAYSTISHTYYRDFFGTFLQLAATAERCELSNKAFNNKQLTIGSANKKSINFMTEFSIDTTWRAKLITLDGKGDYESVNSAASNINNNETKLIMEYLYSSSASCGDGRYLNISFNVIEARTGRVIGTHTVNPYIHVDL